jgi:hypothetical protein
MVVDLLECARQACQVVRLALPPFPFFLNSHLEPLECYV